MFTEYIPFSGENARDHLESHKRHVNDDNPRAPIRDYNFRMPLIVMDTEGCALFRDMEKVKKPSPSSCIALPVTSDFEVAEDDGITTLVRNHLKVKVFTGVPVTQLSVKPLGYYKNYATERNKMPVVVTNIPVIAWLSRSRDQMPVHSKYQKFKGKALWLPIDTAFEAVSRQADEKTENNLAQETYSVLKLYRSFIETQRKAA